jgi:iron complex outermembrane recepter protein
VRHKGLRLALLAGAVWGIGSGLALAADQKPAAQDQSEVVVTAQNRVQRAQDVPISMTVVSGDALKRDNITSIQALAPRLPNVNVIQSVSTDITMIRGIGSGFNGGFEQAVPTFVDGVYRSRARSVRLALFDVDRVEVLRGPQTTYFGNNAIGGAFNITTRRPTPGQPFQSNGSALYSPSDGEYDVEGGVSDSITDKLAARLALQFSGMNGYVYNGETRQDEPHNRDMLGRLSFAYTPTDNFRSDLRLDLGHMNDRGVSANEPIDCPPTFAGLVAKGACAGYLNYAGAAADTTFNYRGDKPSSFFRGDFAETDWTNKLNIGGGTLTAITSYYWHQYDYNYELVPVDAPSPIGTPRWFDYTIHEKFHQFTQELRWDSSIGDRIKYMVGGYYLHSDLDLLNPVGYYFVPFGKFVPGFTATTPVASVLDDTRYTDTKSAFASFDIDLAKGLMLNLAARYSVVDKEGHRDQVAGSSTGTSAVQPGNFTPGTPAQQAVIGKVLGLMMTDFPQTTLTDKAFMPSAELQYKFNASTMAYAKYTRGEKAGGWSTGGTANEFAPEKVNAYEIGFKSSLFDHRAIFDVAAFLSDYQDLQEASNNTLPSGQVVSFVGNVARARAEGVELNSSWRLTDRLSMDANIAWLSSRYTDYPNASCNTIQSALKPVGCTQDLTGRTRPFAPDWSGEVSFHYTAPLAGRELRIEPTVYFKDQYYTLSTLDPLALQPAFAKLDTRISYGPADGSWEIAVIGKNLNNEFTAVQYNSLISSPGSAYVVPDLPRTIAFQISFRH